MTQLEKDEIVDYVLSYLKTNSISINELQKVDSLIGLEHFSALKKEVDGSYNAVKFDLSLLSPGLRLNNGYIEYKDLSTNTWITLISQEELLPIINDKIDKSKIADNLTTADSSFVLSSNQGVVLKSFIDDKIDKSKIADNLTTADASSVLSSNQGVVLKSFIDDLNEKVFPLSVNIGSDELYKSGTIQNVTLNWTVLKGGTSINPDSQNINNVSIANNLKTFTYNNVTTNTDYNITVEYNGLTASDIKKVEFVNPSYFGILNVDTDITERNIKILTEIIKKTKSYSSSTVTLNNQKTCYAYPKAFGNLTSIKDSNNFEYLNSYSLSELTINNEIYNIYILKDAVSISGFKQTFN